MSTSDTLDHRCHYYEYILTVIVRVAIFYGTHSQMGKFYLNFRKIILICNFCYYFIKENAVSNSTTKLRSPCQARFKLYKYPKLSPSKTSSPPPLFSRVFIAWSSTSLLFNPHSDSWCLAFATQVQPLRFFISKQKAFYFFQVVRCNAVGN